MKYRPLGGTGIEVSEIGFGCWGIGGVSRGATSYGPTDDDVSRRALRRAIDLGVTFFDTSDLYGYGHSERLLGETFCDIRSQVVIASKVGFLEHEGPQDFSAAHIRSSLEQSLRRLRTDYLDLYQLHSPDIAVLQEQSEPVETLQQLQREGKIRAFGISSRSAHDGRIAVERFAIGSLQVNFNLVDQRSLEEGVFALCERQGVGVIARTPLCFGFLTARYSEGTAFREDDHRSTWSVEQRTRWAQAQDEFATALGRDLQQTRAQIALRFCLSYSAVSASIPGMLTPSEVEENAAASDLGPLGESELRGIEAIYREQTFFLGKKSPERLSASHGA